jgi:drug/metabolite transporter (DMT)-like permease
MSDARAAMLLMVAGSLTIPIVDVLAKLLTEAHAPTTIAWARYVATLAFVLPIVLLREAWAVLRPHDLRLHLVRGVLMVAGMVTYIEALAAVPVTTALGGLFLSPVIASILAVPLLGERLTVRRVAAVSAGFVGAMAVLQPGTAMPVGGLWALLSGLIWAVYTIFARRSGQGRDSSLVGLTVQNACAALLLTPVVLVSGITLGAAEMPTVVAMGFVSGFAFLAMLAALRRGEASAVAPLMYLELVTATALGLLVFGDWPNALAWAGIVLVVGAGLSVRAGPQAVTSKTRARTS